MSTKNIALNSKVYELLAQFKGESESFSRAIERLLAQVKRHHTGSDILRQLGEVPPLGQEDAETMLGIVEEHRSEERWSHDDLR